MRFTAQAPANFQDFSAMCHANPRKFSKFHWDLQSKRSQIFQNFVPTCNSNKVDQNKILRLGETKSKRAEFQEKKKQEGKRYENHKHLDVFKIVLKINWGGSLPRKLLATMDPFMQGHSLVILSLLWTLSCKA